MRMTMRASAMWIAGLCLGGVPLAGQTAASGPSTPATESTGFSRLDLGLTYSAKFIKITDTSGPWQAMNGFSADGAYNFGGKLKHLGLAADLSYEGANAIKPGVNLKQFTLVAGPRYTLKSKAGARVYAEALFGYVHSFDSVFPTGLSVSSTANSFAMQLGGGASVPFNKRIGWRIVELDYIGTRLPNNGDNYQADLRLSTGLAFHF